MPGDAHAGYSRREEFVHAITHGLGFVLSAAGVVALVALAAVHGDARHVIGCGIFGLTLVLAYGASTLYHGVSAPRAKRTLRVADHAAIYLLIAGSYTPFALTGLAGRWGSALLISVWALCLIGIGSELVMPRIAQRLSLPLYLAMGWLVVVAVEPLGRALGSDGLTLLVLGGAAYTGGVVFYSWSRCPYHHAIWHAFVLAGSGLHFSCVLGYVIPSGG